VLVPSQDKLEGLQQEWHWALKRGDEGGGLLISPDGVAPSQSVSVSASDIFPCTTISRSRFLLALAHPGSLRKSAINGCVSACSLMTGRVSSLQNPFIPLILKADEDK